MPLFLPRIIEKHIKDIEGINPKHRDILSKWSENVLKGIYDSETQNDAEFIQRILVDVLGYVGAGNAENWSVAKNQPVGKGNVDVALGYFSLDSSQIVAPFELKGAKTKDLDSAMSGRNKSPVQQAWEYAMDIRGAEWVLVSNYREIRLYAFGYGRKDYEVFDLSKLEDQDQYARFILLLSAENLLGGKTAALLKETEQADKEITKQLYMDFKDLRGRLIKAIEDNNPAVSALDSIKYTQTILDRILFVAFAEDKYLLPEHTLQNAYEVKNHFNPQPIWDNFKGLFHAIDKGNASLKIPGYNGGLFADNAAINDLLIPDDLCEGFKKIGEYRFNSEVSVNILGHIFEQSISDLEELKAAASEDFQETDKKQSKRKKDGIFYTPAFVTRYIVERAVGTWLQDRKESIGFPSLPPLSDEDYASIKIINTGKGKEKVRQIVYNKKIEQHILAWERYKEALSGIKVLDPACGSGAFLNEVFDYLKAEGDIVNSELTRLKGEQAALFRWDTHILANNIYGVDLNSESVEITKLSLWLKTANRNEKLTYLEDNIKVGNSLIDSSLLGEASFNWREKFSSIMNNGGFDVVLGNPPYTYRNAISDLDKKFYKSTYESTEGNFDLYKFFMERSIQLVAENGYVSFIVPNTFLSANTYKSLRHIILQHYNIVELFDLGLNVFEDVVVENIIFVFQKKLERLETEVKIQRNRDLPLIHYQHKYFIDLREKYNSEQNEFNINISPAYDPVIEKMEADSVSLSSIAYCTVGINTGYIKNDLTSLTKLDDRYHRVLNGKDIDRHTFEWPGEWIMYDHAFVKSKGELGRTLPREDIFTEPKILLQRTRRGMKRKLVAYLDREEYFNLNRVSNIIIENNDYILEYIYCILNSMLMDFYFNIKFNEYEVKPSHLNRLPIKEISIENQNLYEVLTTKVLNKTKELKMLREKLLDMAYSDFGNFKPTNKLKYWEEYDWKVFEKELSAKKILLKGAVKEDWYDRFKRFQQQAEEIKMVISKIDQEIDLMVFNLYEINQLEQDLIKSYYK